jgi:hypothetical protein
MEKKFMHCPRCGQEQSSDEIRFCTKCGLAMSEVKQLLVPGSRETKKQRKNKIGKAVRQGVGMMVFGFVLVAALAILRDLGYVPQIVVKIATLVFCIGGVVRMGLPFIFGAGKADDEKAAAIETDPKANASVEGISTGKLLEEAEYRPPLDFGVPKYDTAKIAAVPSVTEDTTKSLEEEFLPR